jgi:hypothetical protein
VNLKSLTHKRLSCLFGRSYHKLSIYAGIQVIYASGFSISRDSAVTSISIYTTGLQSD